MGIAYYDIETDAIDRLEGQRTITVIHSLAIAVNDDNPLVFTSIPTEYSDGSLLEGVALLNKCDINIGHNSIGFDKPVIEQVLGEQLTAKQLDTMILAKLTYTKDALFNIDFSLNWKNDPAMSSSIGSYGLEAFGLRLGNEKIDFHDWSKLTEDMCIYNKQDVVVTRALYKVLLEQDTFPIQRVIDVEMDTALVVNLISTTGFYVDKQLAEKLRDRLMHEKFTIKRELLSKYKPIYVPGVVKSPHTVVPAKARKVKVWMYNPSFQGYWVWKAATTLTNKLLQQPDAASD